MSDVRHVEVSESTRRSGESPVKRKQSKHASHGGPATLTQLRAVGPRPNALQIAAPKHLYRPAALTMGAEDNHELLSNPLATPTGPNGAPGFRNRAGSQIATPHVTNVYCGPFWGERSFLGEFSKAIVEFGYLEPLAELGYGTGPGAFLGDVDGASIAPGSVFTDSAARDYIAAMLSANQLHADSNSLFMLILPTGVVSQLDGDGSQSCTTFCGYHDCFTLNGVDVAYAVLPSPEQCSSCGNGDIGAITAVYAHELAEAATDKVPGKGWVADDGQENGDLEAWILHNWGPASDPSRYVVQGYYTNERGNTIGAWNGPVA